MADEQKPGGWWATLPGVLTALAGTITAVAGLLVAFHQTGLLEKPSPPESQPVASQPQSVRHDGTERAASLPLTSRYPVALASGAEIKVGAGEIVYKILSAQLDRAADGKLSLKFTVRITCNQSYPCLFSSSSFRLLVDGVARAPVSGPSEAVPSNSSQEGDAAFVIPDTTETVEFLVMNQQDKYSIPIDLKTGRSGQ